MIGTFQVYRGASYLKDRLGWSTAFNMFAHSMCMLHWVRATRQLKKSDKTTLLASGDKLHTTAIIHTLFLFLIS